MPTQYAATTTRARRLLWTLILVLLLVGVLSVFISVILPGAIKNWLHQRGLEAQIEYVQISLPRLRASLYGVRARNQQGRGFHAREATLGLSWWHLLRGKVHVESIGLVDAYLDIDSHVTDAGRIWEIGGIVIGRGEGGDRDYRLELGAVRARDSELCYQHNPQWATPSCFQFGDLLLDDFFVVLRRRGDDPAQLQVGMEELRLRDTLIKDGGAQDANTAIVDLRLSNADFVRPGNRISAEEITARRFASCPPKRWAEALPALGRLIGHCASVRRLEVSGGRNEPLQFSFGAGAEVQWRRANGQGVKLRYTNRRWQNWRAETIAINSFFYSRAEDRLTWMSAGASALDWCPKAWRNREHHYCVRAGNLRLPEPASFDWSRRLQIEMAGGHAQQLQLLDIPGANPDPITANDFRASALSYRAQNRTLQLETATLGGASGCIPGQLWQREDLCVQLKTLRAPETLSIAFANPAEGRAAGFASGEIALDEFALAQRGQRQLLVRDLHWVRANFLRGAAPMLLQDFRLRQLSGCVPDALLPQKFRPLCAEALELEGRGSFVYRGGEDAYAVLGELQLASLQLADRLQPDRGLRLQQLRTGSGHFRRDNLASGGQFSSVAMATAGGAEAVGESDAATEEESATGEKGLLPHEIKKQKKLAARRAPEAREADTALNLELQSLSLMQMDGCLPGSWMHLLYGGRQNMPGCFALRNLRQQQPLTASWQRGFAFTAAELSLEKALAQTTGGKTLLQIDQLHLPRAQISHRSEPRRTRVQLPNFALDKFHGCLPQDRLPQDRLSADSQGQNVGCLSLERVRSGEEFYLRLTEARLNANLSQLLVQRLLLTDREDHFIAHIERLKAARVAVDLPPGQSAAALQFDQLQAARLDACVPEPSAAAERKDNARPLPRCVSAQNLRSVNGGAQRGLVLEQLQLKSAPVAEPEFSVARLRIAEILAGAARESTISLRGVELVEIRGCGLGTWLPPQSRMPGCVRAERLQLPGDNRIGLGGETEPLQLGPLSSSAIELSATEQGPAQLSLQGFTWRSLTWPGGAQLRVTDLRLRDIDGCLPRAADARERLADCIQLRELNLPGEQLVSLALPFSVSGALQLGGISLRRGGREILASSSLQLPRPVFDREGLLLPGGELSGLAGCLPRSWFGESGLAPCYQLGRVTLRSSNRFAFGGQSGFALADVDVEGLQLVQADFPAGSRAQLLQVENLHMQSLEVSGGDIDARGMDAQGLSSCLPKGYVRGVDHCLALDSAAFDGRYSADGGRVDLSQLQLQGLQLTDSGSEKLLSAEGLKVQQLRADNRLWQLQSLELVKVKFLGRHERDIAYDRHAWTAEMERLRFSELQYHIDTRELEIALVEATRPETLLVRDDRGEFSFGGDPAQVADARLRRDPRTREGPGFKYRIRELYIDRGRLTWLDRSHELDADLRIRRIHLLMRNISNRDEDGPAMLLLSARPGGIGELHMAGEINLQQDRMWDADLHGYIVAGNLIPASPYMERLLGYRILQGQMDAQFYIHIENDEVDAKADMVLNRIKVRRVRDSEQVPVERTFIPLDIALMLLKDGQGNVRFSMPVSGNLYDPQFSFSFIFSHLLQRAIMESLLAYLTPYGVFTLARFAWGRFRMVDFDPVPFAPGSAELSAQGEAQLLEAVEKMRERPDARPGICGVANARDWAALYPNSTPGMRGTRNRREDFYTHPSEELHDELLRLARHRSRKVQIYLLQAGFTARDFIQCAPDYNGKDFGEPRVELSN